MSRPRVLVTGATGFHRRSLRQELLENGYAVRGTVRDIARADVGHLMETAGGSLELVEASLDDDAGWDAAVAGCTFVWHLASPVPAGVPRDENDIIQPAVDGTLRVLGAAARGGVTRVLMASSIDAIVRGHADNTPTRTEADWSVVERSAPYPKSKTLAERAAWDFVATRNLELVAVNPGLVVGPLLHKEAEDLDGGDPAVACAQAPGRPADQLLHCGRSRRGGRARLATEAPGAAGNRYILGTEPPVDGRHRADPQDDVRPARLSRPDPTPPYWVMWLNARVDKVVRLALDYHAIPLRLELNKPSGNSAGNRGRPKSRLSQLPRA
jgi:uncharacterized protein YbjT (DUF2867 family)